jgi:hypothetical protein
MECVPARDYLPDKQGFPVTLEYHSHYPKIACPIRRQTLHYCAIIA